jgi:lipoyl(octanoyl) transferase
LGEDFYRAKGIDVLATDRGGRLTYHGPGQLVGYPIMAIEDVGAYLRTMEAAIIAALSEEGVSGRSRHDEGIDYTGVWVGERKIASIGVHVSHGVTTHGFAVNVVNDLEPFSWVTACGLPDVAMTSLQRELGPSRATGLECVRRRVAFHFAQAHGRRQRLVSARRLGIQPTNDAGLASKRAIPRSAPPASAEAVPAYPMAGHR